MRKLRIGIIDLVTKGPTRALYARVMNGNFASIMPQALAVWCQQAGHDVTLVCYTGFENLVEELPLDADLVFIGAFTESAHTAYALSALFRSRGAATVLGGPHARCYPEDSVRYFDYVLGFTDRPLVDDVLRDCSPHRPLGLHLSAAAQPAVLPGVRERWAFIEPTLRKAPVFKVVSMLGSLGCPYTCSFCIDSTVPYQAVDLDVVREDLRFLLRTLPRPRVAWHDPNFGVRFDDILSAIEDAVPPGRIDFMAESSLSLLSEPRLARLKRNGFQALLPGIESWFGFGEKSRTGARIGMAKVESVADHVNTILRYVPYVQGNLVFGLDTDEGPEPFELTKRFVDLAPGAYPSIQLLTAFGQAAPANLEYQRANRVTPVPFHFLDNSHGNNVRPKNYDWLQFYDHVIDLIDHALSWRAIARRFRAGRGMGARWLNFVRAVSVGGRGWLAYNVELRRRLASDPQVRRFYCGESDEVPDFYRERIRRDLGPLWEWLPSGGLRHDPNGWRRAVEAGEVPANDRAAAPPSRQASGLPTFRERGASADGRDSPPAGPPSRRPPPPRASRPPFLR